MTTSRRPPQWPEGAEAAQPRLALALTDPQAFAPDRKEQAVVDILQHMPGALRAALLAELGHGNRMVSIDRPDWPASGSVFVCMLGLFHPSTRHLDPRVVWKDVNDPHFWRQELSQSCDGVEHLIIC